MALSKKSKRVELSLQDKIKLINESKGMSCRQLAETFGIGKTQVSTILKEAMATASQLL